MYLGVFSRIGRIRNQKRFLATIVAVILILIFLGILLLRTRAAPLASPVFENIAESRVRRLVGEVAQELITEGNRGEFCTLTYTSDGGVMSLWVNSEAVNRFCADLSRQLETRLSKMALTCKIKSGDLVCPQLFSGSGLPLTVRGSVYGSVSVQAVSDLIEGGLNQTLHRLEVEVTVPLTIMVLGEESRMTVISRVLIGETVIVGALPGGVVVGG